MSNLPSTDPIWKPCQRWFCHGWETQSPFEVQHTCPKVFDRILDSFTAHRGWSGRIFILHTGACVLHCILSLLKSLQLRLFIFPTPHIVFPLSVCAHPLSASTLKLSVRLFNFQLSRQNARHSAASVYDRCLCVGWCWHCCREPSSST